MQGSALTGQVGVNYCTTGPCECVAHEMSNTSFGDYFATRRSTLYHLY